MLKRVVAVLLILVLTMSGTAGASNAQEQRITREEPQETASLEGMTRWGNLQPPGRDLRQLHPALRLDQVSG